MRNQFFIGWAAVYVFNSASGYIIHHVILGHIYRQIASSLHANVMNRLWAFIIVSLAGSFFLTLIYSKWKKKGTVTEGLQFGLLAGLWITVVSYLSAYASSEAIPLSLVFKWIGMGVTQYTLAGYILAVIFNSSQTISRSISSSADASSTY